MSDLNPSPEFEEKVRMAVDMPSARPEFVNQLRNELARKPVGMKPRLMFRPAWAIAFVLALAVIVVSVPGVAAAIGRLFGYVPEVGLVETTNGLRMLAEPVSLTREGVTLTVKRVFVFADRVELAYEVKGIDPANDGWQAEDAGVNPTAFCGGVNIGEMDTQAGDALLRLPDGTLLERDRSGMYPKNAYAMTPVYAASIPADVTEMTMLLDCIPMARLGAVPENWEVPFELISVPAGTLLGEPVIEVAPTIVMPGVLPTERDATVPVPVVTMTLERVVSMDSSTIFYFSMDMENKDPSLISIMPVNVYVIDSSGQKSQLMGNFTWQPFEHRPGSAFEFMLRSKLANGPLTLVVENAVAYYAPLYVDPPQATADEMSFTFDAGINPQHGQIWDLDNVYEIAGYQLKVTSAQATTYDDVKSKTFDFNFISQGFEYGYDFAVEADPSSKMQVEMDIISESPVCGLSNTVSLIPDSSSLHYVQLCRDDYPNGNVRVVIRELSVLIENAWQVTWTPPAQ